MIVQAFLLTLFAGAATVGGSFLLFGKRVDRDDDDAEHHQQHACYAIECFGGDLVGNTRTDACKDQRKDHAKDERCDVGHTFQYKVGD